MSYLNQVIAKEGILESNAEIVLFGFSQGVATACRFGAFSKLDFKKLVLWAGTFPPDIPVELTNQWGNKVDMIYFTGNQDPFFKEGMIERQYDQVKVSTGGKPRLIRFEGKHEVLPALLHHI